MKNFLEEIEDILARQTRVERRRTRVARGLHLGPRLVDGHPTQSRVEIAHNRRAESIALLGKTGSGKSYLLKSLQKQDIQESRGFVAFDLHGDLSPFILGTIADQEKLVKKNLDGRTIIVEPDDPTMSVGINPIESRDGNSRFIQIAEFTQVLRQRWHLESFGARTDELLRNSLYVLAENGLTLLEVGPLLSHSGFRARCLKNVTNTEVRQYFELRYDSVSEPMRAIMREPILNKIPGRELIGYAEFVKKFRVGIASDHPTARRIFAWFGRIYGDRLKMDLDFGRSVVLVQGEICQIRASRFYGTMLIVCSPIGMSIRLKQEIAPGVSFTVRNLLVEDVEDLTPDLARRLSATECEAILKSYAQTFLTFSRLEACLGARRGGKDAPYVKEAMHDLRSSVASLMTSPPSYAQSKWESLQAVEKVVKSCILERGSTHEKHHKLSELFTLAESLGVPYTDPAMVASVQVSPGMRYDSSPVSKADAFSAHSAALTICGNLALVIKRTTAQSQVDDYEFPLHDISLRGLMLHFAAPAPPFIL